MRLSPVNPKPRQPLSYIIVCGLDRTGYRVFCLLREQGARVIGVHSSPIPEEPDLVVGNLRSETTLLAAGIREAHTLLLMSNDDTLNLAILVQARLLNPHIRVINRLFNRSLGERLDRTLTDHVTLSVSELAAPVFAFAALGNQAIGQLQLFGQTWPIHEEYIHAQHPWEGRSLKELWEDRERMLIYYLPMRDNVDLVSAIEQGQTLRVGDRLIVATRPRIRRGQRSLRLRLSKMVRSLQRFQQYGRSAVWVTFILLLTIFIATFTYVSADFRTSLIDALYFSVGMITGAGGNEFVVENASAITKIFTVIMMLVGAAVIGIFYALLNDLILGTHLRRLWDVAQVPPRNHFIVCGLGGVGVKTMQQLRSQGYEVVVIERDHNNRLLNAVRSHKIPIIQCDATLATTLQDANIEQAAALLAVTSDDTANLEIALSAKGLSPRLPVVVRNQDPQFAQMAQQVFAFGAVLSPTELAAPSFAAAALGGRILGNGMTANTLWVAVATQITPSHPFCHQRIKDAAMEIDFVPLYLEPRPGIRSASGHRTIHGWELLESRLYPDDVLYLTLPAHQLEQLWRSASPFPQVVIH